MNLHIEVEFSSFQYPWSKRWGLFGDLRLSRSWPFISRGLGPLPRVYTAHDKYGQGKGKALLLKASERVGEGG